MAKFTLEINLDHDQFALNDTDLTGRNVDRDFVIGTILTAIGHDAKHGNALIAGQSYDI